MIDGMSDADVLALDLTRTAARFTRTVGRFPGIRHSAVVWRVLAELEDGPARTTTLAEQHRVTQPTMTGLVQRLTSEGWVTREADPEDRRASLITITEGGVKALARYREAAADQIRPLLAELNAQEQDTLGEAVTLMQRLCDLAD
jgi:DNA-binding MarR family transcriptional regulator